MCILPPDGERYNPVGPPHADAGPAANGGPTRIRGQKKASRSLWKSLILRIPYLVLTSETPAFAIVEGALCVLNRRGVRTTQHAPLATAVVEFRRGRFRWYVREHPYGLLPGIPNLYCLDAALRLQWMAEWPVGEEPCAGILAEEAGALVTVSSSGNFVRLDAATGALLSVTAPMAQAG